MVVFLKKDPSKTETPIFICILFPLPSAFQPRPLPPKPKKEPRERPKALFWAVGAQGLGREVHRGAGLQKAEGHGAGAEAQRLAPPELVRALQQRRGVLESGAFWGSQEP